MTLPVITAGRGRRFSCFPAAVVVYLVDEGGDFLMLCRDRVHWGVVAGALEEGETVLAGAQRELREETGGAVRATPLGVIHAHCFDYDPLVHGMISIHYLMQYDGGTVVPSDDMQGASYAWWSLAEIRRRLQEIAVPLQQYWLFERAALLQPIFAGSRPPFEYSISPDDARHC